VGAEGAEELGEFSEESIEGLAVRAGVVVALCHWVLRSAMVEVVAVAWRNYNNIIINIQIDHDKYHTSDDGDGSYIKWVSPRFGCPGRRSGRGS
jgi:hypothetical protein